MKNLYKISLLAALVLFGACSKEYLVTAPTSSTGTNAIFETVDNMELSVNGLYKCMTQQYGAFGQGYNGEGTIKYYIGTMAGNNFNMCNSGNIYLVDNSYHVNPKSTWILYPWYYYYRIIGNANTIIENGPNAQGDEAKRDYLIAQAKVMRAYCYTMLAQRFFYRWSMGKNSEAKNGNGLVLRMDTSTGDIPLSSAEATYAAIYIDLDEAISVLEKEAYKRNKLSENYQIDANVAKAIYARAALVREDWTTAATMARAAREGFPLMNTKDYMGGFCEPKSEWIWSSYGGTTETLYFYSFQAYMAYNANTSTCRTYPRSISKVLYDKISDTDIRKDMFLNPAGMEGDYSTSTGIATAKSALDKKAREMHPDIPSNAKICAYEQFKFACIDQPGVGHLVHFRSSEMYLIEAEAEYKKNNAPAAQKLMEELIKDSGRDPSYSCTKTGEELFEEIKLYRQIELWGEGFDWFDLKRWNDPIDRKGFKDGGNSYATFAIKVVQSEVNNWWTSVIPEKEALYNKEIK